MLLSEIWTAILISMGAGLIQGLTGFGFGLFAVGLLVLTMPIADAVVITAIMSVASSVLNLISLRHDLNWRDSRPLILASLPFMVLGIYLLKNLDAGLLQMGIVFMILAGGAVSLWAPSRALITREWPWVYLAGFIGGLFGGALNMGGPPVVLYSLLSGWEKARAKSLMATYFVVTGIIRIVLFVLADVATLRALELSAIVLVPAMLCSYGGVIIFRRLSTTMFRYAALAVLMGIAAKILIT
jgi:uncharacterized protein